MALLVDVSFILLYTVAKVIFSKFGYNIVNIISMMFTYCVDNNRIIFTFPDKMQ